MSSDGKGRRKLRAPACPKCNDGLVHRFVRERGRIVEIKREPCGKCKRGKERRIDVGR